MKITKTNTKAIRFQKMNFDTTNLTSVMLQVSKKVLSSSIRPISAVKLLTLTKYDSVLKAKSFLKNVLDSSKPLQSLLRQNVSTNNGYYNISQRQDLQCKKNSHETENTMNHLLRN